MQVIGAIISMLFILFLPGFFLSFVFFKWKRIDIIERIVFSFALSAAVVPLIIFYGNLMGIHITLLTVTLEISGVLFAAGTILALQHIREEK